jgi:hypothetical protein
MTIDERLEALTTSSELLNASVHGLEERARAMEERERRARRALMIAIKAYLDELDVPEEKQ